MEKRLKDYTAYLEGLIASDDTSAMSIIYSDITVQIGFFQHERIVHLIVTVTFAILALMSLWFFTITQMTAVLILFVLFMVLLVPYIRHYYILENGTQHLYMLYDSITQKLRS